MTESSPLSKPISPVICPLAKLGRLSPSCTSFDNRYISNHSTEEDCHQYASSESLDYRQSPYQHSLDINYSQNCVRYSAIPLYQKYSLPLVSSGVKENTFSPNSLFKHNATVNFSGKTSPCLDQGYHTLVPPSPSGWPITNCATKLKKNTIVRCNYFEKLSDDIVLKVFSWLNTTDLCATSAACHRFYNLAWDQSLWKTISINGDKVCADKAIKCILRRLCGQYENTTGNVDIRQIFVYEGAKVSDKGLMLLSRRCPQLTHVHLQNCQSITDNSISELVTKCTNLHHLDLTGCSMISCINLATGPELSRKLLIQYLDLTDCSIQDGGLRVILRNCPQLTYLYLRRCIKVTDAGIKFVPSFCSSLRELSVSDCNEVTDFALYELAKLGPNLRYLSVAKCNRVSDAGLKVIAKRCYKLRYLNVRGCEAVSDDAITILAHSCSRLRALDIGKCDVSDAALRAVAESCPNLKKLSLRNCDLVTDRGVQYVSYYCRGLQQLNIQDCQISVEGYRAVKRYCKRCIIEHTNPGFF